MLTWKCHIDYVASKLSKVVGIFIKIRHYLPKHILSTLYYTFAYPYLIYCNILWASTYVSNLKRLDIIQKKLIRIITFSMPYCHSSPLFKKLKFLAQLTCQSAELILWSSVRRPSSVVRPSVNNSHFRLLLQNRWPDPLQTWQGCALGGSLPSLFKWSRSSDFWIFYEFFCSFFGKILKNLLLRNRLANCFEIAQGHFWVPLDLNLFTRWRCDFFLFFYDFFHEKPIFVFFSRTKSQNCSKPFLMQSLYLVQPSLFK